MKKVNLIALFSMICLAFACKKEDNQSPSNEVFQVVEVQAEFPNGNDKLLSWIASNIQYPQDAKDNKIEGKVSTRFVVEKDGTISEIIILRSLYPSLDEEAKRIIQSMPKWKPAKSNGKAVRSYFSLPIEFKL